MRILIYIEPVVFRGDPLFLAPHVCGWALPLFHAHRDTDIQWAFASSGPLVELAKAQAPDLLVYEIPSWKILRTAEYRRDLYAVALFERTSADQAIKGDGPLAALAEDLQGVNLAFEPDVVIATSQNSLLALIFSKTRCLWMEQALFPRRKGQGRVYFDPCGHQIGSVLEQAAEQIRGIKVNPAFQSSAMELWKKMMEPNDADQGAVQHVQRAVQALAGDRRVALLVLQPPDWLSWEGCLGDSVPPEALLARWAATLPEGWVGIPLYKPHARLSSALEDSLASEFPNLFPLPAELSSNVAEWLLPVADAVITVSSSVAGHALIYGKQVVVSSRSPLRNLASTNLGVLASPTPSLTPQERLGLLAFLSHRYTLTLAEISNPAGPFRAHLRALLESPDPVEWLLDQSDWTPGRLARLV
jgi:hypothetical protein